MNEESKLCLNGCFTIKPITEFSKHPRMRDGLSARCKSCEVKRIQLSKHGMTYTEKCLIATKQGGCAICHRPEPGRKGWVVDHDHACCPGERSCPRCRRGVLCQWCNAALGYAQDDPVILRAAANYLESGVRLVNDPHSTESVDRLGPPTRDTGPTDGRTRRTYEEPLLPTRDTSSSVTRTRAYDDDEVAEYHARVQALRKEARP